MSCDESRKLVHAYADDELDVVAARELDQHLQTCALCRRAFDTAKAVRIALANPALQHRAPADLRSQILGSVRKQAGEARESNRFPRRAWGLVGLAASIFIAAAGYLAFIDSTAPTQLAALDAQEVLDLHARSLQPAAESRLYDVQSTDQHTVKPWFDHHLDFSPPVRQLDRFGFELIGGRLDYLHDHSAAALVYTRGKHVINLFIWPGETGASADSRRGFNLIQWSAGGMTFWAVSDLNRQELSQFVDLFRAEPASAAAPR